MLFVGKWMDLETEKVSQAEKDTSYDIAYMWNIFKNGANKLTYKTELSHRYRKQTYCYQGGGRMEG